MKIYRLWYSRYETCDNDYLHIVLFSFLKYKLKIFISICEAVYLKSMTMYTLFFWRGHLKLHQLSTRACAHARARARGYVFTHQKFSDQIFWIFAIYLSQGLGFINESNTDHIQNFFHQNLNKNNNEFLKKPFFRGGGVYSMWAKMF